MLQYKNMKKTMRTCIFLCHYEGDTWRWTFTIPEGATADVTLPGETVAKEYGAGTYTLFK